MTQTIVNYYTTLDEMFPDGKSYDILKAKWTDADESELKTFCDWFDEFILSYYPEDAYEWTPEEDTTCKKGFLKLRRYFVSHINEMVQVADWYSSNKEALLDGTMKSITDIKNSDCSQDGTSYIDSYPTTETKTEQKVGTATALDNFNKLLRRYRNYQRIWADAFVKEERLEYVEQ